MTHAGTAPHETAGNLIYTERGLRPYWAISTLHANGFDEPSDEIEMPIDEESWTVSLTSQEGGIAPRPEDVVGGNRLSEFRLAASGRGERKAHYLIQPRFTEMRKYDTGDPAKGNPFIHIDEDEGLNVRFSGSNLEPDEYRDLLPQFVRRLVQETEVTIAPALFTGPVHEMSNITAHERYLRIDRDWSPNVVGPNGALNRLMRLCASRDGSKCEYRADDREIVGYNHRLVLPEADAERVLSGHEYGKQIKHYHPEHVRRSDDDPLAHPKLCVLVKKALNKRAVPWKDRESLRREVDETLVNLLYWSDVPVNANGTTYVPDPHFPAETAAEPVELVADPLPTLEARQELLLADVVRDMCASDLEVLERLVADGNGQHYAALARKTGRGKSTIYRALRRLSGIVENKAGSVSFTSKKFEQEFAGIVEGPEYEISDPVKRAAHILNLDQSDSGSSPWQEWCRTYAGKLEEATNGSDSVLRIGTVLSQLKSSSNPRLQDVLREAIRAWRTDGRDPRELRRAATKWRTASDTWERGYVSALLR